MFQIPASFRDHGNSLDSYFLLGDGQIVLSSCFIQGSLLRSSRLPVPLGVTGRSFQAHTWLGHLHWDVPSCRSLLGWCWATAKWGFRPAFVPQTLCIHFPGVSPDKPGIQGAGSTEPVIGHLCPATRPVVAGAPATGLARLIHLADSSLFLYEG